MKHASDNGFLAMTRLGLRGTSFKEGFYPWDNQCLDSSEFIPSGATKYHENGEDVVIYRSNEYSY
jgi:hypothetical protein